MAEKPFKLEVEYFGPKVSKMLDKLEDAVGLTLSLGPYVKIGIRDLRPHSSFNTTVGLLQQLPGRRPPAFKIPLEGGDGSLCLVPMSAEFFGWRYITINGHMPPPGVDARNAAINAGVPLALPGYDARRNIFLRFPEQAATAIPQATVVPVSTTEQAAPQATSTPAPPLEAIVPSSPDYGIGSSVSGSSEAAPLSGVLGRQPPMFPRQLCKHGRPRLILPIDASKRLRAEQPSALETLLASTQ